MKLDIECMTSSVLLKIRPAVRQSFWFLGLTLDTICTGQTTGQGSAVAASAAQSGIHIQC